MARRLPKLPLGLVYDAGALIAAEANDRRLWALHARAGSLRRTLPDIVGPIDATVAETARRRGGAVTSDRSDIELLASAARRRIQLIDI
jgi:hypothetical protein